MVCRHEQSAAFMADVHGRLTGEAGVGAHRRREFLTGMAAEGWPLTKELLGRLSPYMRKHLRRFGQYKY